MPKKMLGGLRKSVHGKKGTVVSTTPAPASVAQPKAPPSSFSKLARAGDRIGDLAQTGGIPRQSSSRFRCDSLSQPLGEIESIELTPCFRAA